MATVKYYESGMYKKILAIRGAKGEPGEVTTEQLNTAIENKFDVTNVGSKIASLNAKTPVNADSILIVDSEESNTGKETTFTQLKTFFKSYFDTLYNTKEIPLGFALSDETTALTTGVKLTYRMPFACSLTRIPRINLNTVSSSGLVTVDIKKNGTTIFSTLLTIDVSEKTSVTAVAPCVLSSNPTTFADDDEISFDITVAGTGAKGLKATLYIEKV